MYQAHETLSGQESSSFWRLWDTVGSRLQEIIDLGPRIRQAWDRANYLQSRTTDPDVRKQLGSQKSRLSDMLMTWNEVKERIDKWLPEWVKITNTANPSVDGLGVVPLVLPAWALLSLATGGLAALAYVASHGLDLIKQYQAEQNILDRLGKGEITQEGAKGFIEVLQPKEGNNPFAALTGNIGSMLPWVAGVGALIFFGPILLQRYRG